MTRESTSVILLVACVSVEVNRRISAPEFYLFLKLLLYFR